jgi:hypothetical protein
MAPGRALARHPALQEPAPEQVLAPGPERVQTAMGAASEPGPGPEQEAEPVPVPERAQGPEQAPVGAAGRRGDTGSS